MKLFRRALLFVIIGGFLCLHAAPAPASTENEEMPWIFEVTPFAFVYMTDLARPQPPEEKLRVRIKTGVQHDSNVILNAGGSRVPPGIPKQEDWRGLVNINASYSLYKAVRSEASVAYTFFQSFHNDLSDFNVTQNLFESSWTYRIAPAVSVKANYTFQHMLLGGDLYDYANVAGISAILAGGKGFFTSFDYKLSSARLRNVSIFQRNGEMSGYGNLFGITQNIYWNNVFFRFGYSFDRSNAQREYWEYAGHKGFIWGTFKLSKDLIFDIYGEYYRRDYEGANPFGGGIDRNDNSTTAVVTLTKYFLDRYGVSLRLFYMRNESTVALFDYKRVIPSLLVGIVF